MELSDMDLPQRNAPSEWIYVVKESCVTKKSGIIEEKDESNRVISIHWKTSDIISSELAEFKETIADLASEVLAPIEVKFLKVFPEALNQEMYLRPSAPLFAQGIEAVNWALVEESIKSTIKQFYMTDLSKFGMDVVRPLLNDVYLFTTITDKESNTLLGFMIGSVTPALPYGDLKVINISVVDVEKNRGLERLLIKSIFSALPEVTRIFCYERPTNTDALTRYENLGFTQDPHPFEDPQHKINRNFLLTLQYKNEATTSQ